MIIPALYLTLRPALVEPRWAFSQKTNAEILDEASRAAKEGRGDTIPSLLDGLKEPSAIDQSRLLNLLCEALPLALPTRSRPTLLAAIRVARGKVPNAKEAGMYDCQLALAEARTLEAMGRHREALRALDEVLPRAAEPARPVLARMRGSLALVGTKAPAVPLTESLGNFSGLDPWKGKVVLLDFFAHWCKPCIAAFPSLRGIYAELHGQGLEIAGLTRYYGYYGARQGISKPEELAAMKEFCSGNSLPWAVAFVPSQVEDAYCIMALPSTVVIDRKGTVRHVSFGFDPKESDELRTLLKTLLNEK